MGDTHTHTHTHYIRTYKRERHTPSHIMSVTVTAGLHLGPQALTQLDAMYWDVATPASDNYLVYPSDATLRHAMDVDADEHASVVQWMEAMGCRDVTTSHLGDRVTCVVEEAFYTAPPASLAMAFVHTTTGDGGPAPARGSVHSNTMPIKKDAMFRSEYGPYTVPNIKAAYGIPLDLTSRHTRETQSQMVWGPGTFGYGHEALENFKRSECGLLNTNKVVYDTANHGVPHGDNFFEGTLDVQMISAYGLNITTVVSNTNTSASTEEGTGFGLAMLNFITELASRKDVPQILSLSLGSLSAGACDILCDQALTRGVSKRNCNDYLQQQRQVCMFLSPTQVERIDAALATLGLRGVTVFGASGDGGSHFSFERFRGGYIADALNEISCAYNLPTYPSSSPYVVAVGGEQWADDNSTKPIAWQSSGGGFSWQLPQPAHQQKAVSNYLATAPDLPSPQSYNPGGRAYPDVCAIAIEGTSMSTPITGGIWSLITSLRIDSNLPPLGPLGPRLYHVAEMHPDEAFEDITQGNTRTSCKDGFPATKGYDPITGLGRPVWAGLVKYFASDDHL